LEGTCGYPLMDRINGKNRPILATKLSKIEKGLSISRLNDKYKHSLGIDFSAYDSNIDADIIRIAFKILKSHFNFTTEEKKI
jgi:hypothetical protein